MLDAGQRQTMIFILGWGRMDQEGHNGPLTKESHEPHETHGKGCPRSLYGTLWKATYGWTIPFCFIFPRVRRVFSIWMLGSGVHPCDQGPGMENNQNINGINQISTKKLKSQWKIIRRVGTCRLKRRMHLNSCFESQTHFKILISVIFSIYILFFWKSKWKKK